MTALNILYGVLTDGDNSVRKTTTKRQDFSKEVIDIANALVPTRLSSAGKRALTELYIRLAATDKVLIAKLTAADPVNSYVLHSIYPDFTDDITLSEIVTSIKALALADEENSFLPIDYVRNALEKLLDKLKG